MSLTRKFRKLLIRSGSGGVSRVTVGLSSVGPPPALMTIQVLASPTTVGVPRALDVVRGDEVAQQNVV